MMGEWRKGGGGWGEREREIAICAVLGNDGVALDRGEGERE